LIKPVKHPHTSKYESNSYLLTRIFDDYVKEHYKAISVAVLCMILISITTSLNAYSLKPVLDDIFINKDQRMLYIIPIAIAINGLIKALATFYQSSIMKTVGQKILTNIQLELYSHLINSDIQFFDDHPSGNLISRFTNDINAMRRTVTEIFTVIAIDFCTAVGLIALMFSQSPELAMIIFFIGPAAFYPIRKLGRRMRSIAKNIQEELSGFTTMLDETFQNIRIIKSYSREDYEVSRAQKIIDRFLNIYRKAAYVESASSPIMELIGTISIIFVIVYGGSQVLNERMTPGTFFLFIGSLLMIYRPLKSISSVYTSMQEGLVASRRLFLLFDVQPKIFDEAKLKRVHFKSYNMLFSNVYFSYKSGVKILDGIHLNIKEGQTVALVGSSGSGKSTIFHLLQRLYDPDYGDITIGNISIKDVKLTDLRNSIAFVGQDVALFDDSVRENIRYGRLNATEEEIVDASLAAAAHDFITNLSDGYDTQIGQKGVKLSGGQKQRIAIARAILKNAPILLLDEATSALDAISEKQVQMALEYLKKGRTTIVIAHRLSTIENADLIYVISDGRIKEFGSHSELLEKKGEYANLYQEYKKEKVDD
jgi:ATP-binding cassette, subfamily B, bacterial MsbA